MLRSCFAGAAEGAFANMGGVLLYAREQVKGVRGLGKTGSKHPWISRNWRDRVAPLFRWFRLVSMKSEARHGRRGRWYVVGVLREATEEQ